MFDLVHLRLLAGNGGNGRVSFRREKYVPKGGPDGGNGGQGGSIYLRANKSLNSLQHFAGVKEYVAQSGQAGGAKNQIGRDGEDIYLDVPVGTRVWLVGENRVSRIRRVFRPHEGQAEPVIKHQILTLSVKGGRPEALPADEIAPLKLDNAEGAVAPDPATPAPAAPAGAAAVSATMLTDSPTAASAAAAEPQVLRSASSKLQALEQLPKVVLIELTTDGQTVRVAQGGTGGRGNTLFKSSRNTTPITAEYGTSGERKEVILELRLIADIGLVGYPNAGKSTLLSVVTRANPKIANYPFTTLEPNLGVMFSAEAGGRDLIMADIPGIIEGASQGKGLGYDFLRHIQACRVLVFVLTLEESIIFDPAESPVTKAAQLWQQYQILAGELASYDPALADRRRLLTLSKADLYPPELVAAVQAQFSQAGESVLPFSAAARLGLNELQQQLRSILRDAERSP